MTTRQTIKKKMTETEKRHYETVARQYDLLRGLDFTDEVIMEAAQFLVACGNLTTDGDLVRLCCRMEKSREKNPYYRPYTADQIRAVQEKMKQERQRLH